MGTEKQRKTHHKNGIPFQGTERFFYESHMVLLKHLKNFKKIYSIKRSLWSNVDNQEIIEWFKIGIENCSNSSRSNFHLWALSVEHED